MNGKIVLGADFYKAKDLVLSADLMKTDALSSHLEDLSSAIEEIEFSDPTLTWEEKDPDDFVI